MKYSILIFAILLNINIATAAQQAVPTEGYWSQGSPNLRDPIVNNFSDLDTRATSNASGITAKADKTGTDKITTTDDIQSSSVIVTEQTQPATPASGFGKIYARDGEAYFLNDEGTEKEITGASGSSVWGSFTGTLSDQADLQNALDGKANSLGADDNYVTDTEKTNLHAPESDNQVGDGVTITGTGTPGDPFVSVGGTIVADTTDPTKAAKAVEAEELAAPKVSGQPGYSFWFEAETTNELFTGFQGPADLSVNISHVMPSSAGTVGQVFEIDTVQTGQTLPNGEEGTLVTLKNSDPRAIKTATYATSQSLTTEECRGYIIYVTGSATITLPAIADGMSVSIITIGAVAVSVDPNASDLIYLDGTALDDGDKITNTSTAGDIAVLTYYSGVGWYATTNSWTDGGI